MVFFAQGVQCFFESIRTLFIELIELRNILKSSNEDDFSGIGSVGGCRDEESYGKLVRSLKRSFEDVLDSRLITDEPSKHELKLARELESGKYSTEEWNAKR